MAIEATVEQDFVAYTRMKKGQAPEEHSFKKGDKVSVTRIWTGDLCLIKSAEGKVFNIKKAHLNQKVFEAAQQDDKGKSRRKRSRDVPDYAALSEIRPELDMERGLAPDLGEAVERSLVQGVLRFFRSRSGAAVTAAVAILAIYLTWQNVAKARNDTPYGRLAAAVLERGKLHKPGHLEPSYRSLQLNLDGSQAEARVHDSLWGGRTLTLKVPGPKTAILASEQEDRWLNNKQFRSAYYDEFVDESSDGTVDRVVRVLEFRSDTNRLVAAYRKAVPHSKAHERRYRESVQKIIRSLPGGG